jgi:hypothetical protein
VNRLRKYIEQSPDGRQLRVAYAMTLTTLPEARPRSQWQEVAPFSAADEILAEPELKTVFKAAIERGFAVVARSERAREMTSSPLGLIFTIEVDGRPTVTFEARQLREAAELSKEEWLRADLNALSSNGVPLCRIGSKLKARTANEVEREVYREAVKEAMASDEIVLAYLVELDGIETTDEMPIDPGSFPPKR